MVVKLGSTRHIDRFEICICGRPTSGDWAQLSRVCGQEVQALSRCRSLPSPEIKTNRNEILVLPESDVTTIRRTHTNIQTY